MTSTDEGILTAAIFLGMMLGGWVWGSMADQAKYGRIKVLQYSLFVNALFGALSSIAINFWMLLLIRFISGVGVGGSIPVTFSYASEFFDNKVRGKYLALIAVSWPVGAIFTSLLAWLIVDDPFEIFSFNLFGLHIESWRIFLLPCAIPALVGSILFGYFSDNSPKFLIFNKGNYYQASKVLIKIAKQNGSYDRICYGGGSSNSDRDTFDATLSLGELDLDVDNRDLDLGSGLDGHGTNTHNLFDPTTLRRFAKKVLFYSVLCVVWAFIFDCLFQITVFFLYCFCSRVCNLI